MKSIMAGLISSLLLFVTGYFLYRMYKFNILPLPKFILVIGIVFIVFAIVLKMSKHKVTQNASIILAMILICVYAYLSYSLTISKDMLDHITGADGQSQEVQEMVSVVVMSGYNGDIKTLDNKAIALDSSFNQEANEKAFEEIKSKYKLNISKTNIADNLQLLDGLYNGTYAAIIINSSKLSLMTDMKETFEEDTRVLEEINVTNIVTTKAPDDNKPSKPSANNSNNSNQPTKAPSKKEPITERPFVVYISGIDTTGNINVKSRSDTNILMFVNPNTGKILMVSTPRDTYTPLYNVSGSAKDKLTHAGLYGIDCSIGTLESIYGINIDYYLRINFTSVENIVDALGGVSVYSAKEFDSANIKGYHFNEGMNDVNGKKALVFCRERYSFSDGDFQRGRNHIEMIKAVVKKCTSPSVLLGLPEVISAINDYFQTNMTSDEITSLIRLQIDKNINWEFDSLTLNNIGSSSTTCYSLSGPKLYVGLIDEASLDNIKKEISNFLN